ncbi:MAG: substrate-binding domain-containing protein [Dermabacter sp.]|nr:substrate-binding domain-containing protein [Dermabacter sp.]
MSDERETPITEDLDTNVQADAPGSSPEEQEAAARVAPLVEDKKDGERSTLTEVANSLGITDAVALRALRGEADINSKLITTVRETAERLNYPLEDLTSEDDHRGVVAVLVNTMRNTWISDLVRSIRIELAATGRHVVVVPTRQRMPEYPVALDETSITSLVRLGVDGFIMASEIPELDKALEAVGNRPLVSIGGSHEHVGTTDTVRIDDNAGFGLLIDHLVALGHRDIAHVGGVGYAVARERAEAFKHAMQRHGLLDRARVEPADFSEQVGQTAGSMLLRGSQVPTAITCSNDVSAIGVLSAAEDAGFEVPAQLAVTGYGNTSIAASGVAQVTSIDPNSRRIGALGAQFLVERIGGFQGPARDVLVSPHLAVRRSSSAGPRPEQTRRRRVTID